MSESRIILAPMEGVLDYSVRQLLTILNDIDYCVTEFVRVTNHKLSHRTFYRLCPELYHNGETLSGTNVRVQLLGQCPELMAENAATAIMLGSYGIDVNCGCPAKTVVGHQGGAYLLQYPEKIYAIVHAIKQSIPETSPLSVKIRLGWQDKSYCYEIASAIESAGASEIVIHGRTKEDGYKADKIDWHSIGLIKQKLTIPVIANGEIFTVDDAKKCRDLSQTTDIMLGRGMLAMPNLANRIRYNDPILAWSKVVKLLHDYACTELNEVKPLYHSSRIKQWLSYLKRDYSEATPLLTQIRTLKTQAEISQQLAQNLP